MSHQQPVTGGDQGAVVYQKNHWRQRCRDGDAAAAYRRRTDSGRLRWLRQTSAGGGGACDHAKSFWSRVEMRCGVSTADLSAPDSSRPPEHGGGLRFAKYYTVIEIFTIYQMDENKTSDHGGFWLPLVVNGGSLDNPDGANCDRGWSDSDLLDDSVSIEIRLLKLF
ncbi:hypothetical protein Rs2_50278 [Raphanus sativus]|nr:hypothetical protein Rs2_50278 [Raphanus sativus]